MSRVLALAILGIVCSSSPNARGQDKVRYLPQLKVGFPVPAEVTDLKPRPTKLRLYTSIDRKPFVQVSERAIDNLDPIVGRRPGFQYTAKADGEEEFALQLVYDDGRVSPAADKLRASYRILFDTRPPVVTLATEGTSGVAWSAQDENLDPDSIKLECRWQDGATTWHTVQKARGSFGARDQYTWSNLGKDNRVLEVRVSAKDKAGHESSSRPVRLPSSANSAGRADAEWSTTPRGAERLPLTGGGVGRLGGDFAGDVPGQPQIMYLNKRDLIVKSKLQTVTTSGVKTVHLFTKDLTRNPNGEWLAAKPMACDRPYGTTNLDVDIPHTVLEDGRYGFIVIPESVAGNRDLNPRSVASAQHLVEVDTKAPVVKLRRVIATPGGSTGTRLEIEWDADDINMMPDPIVLEYAAEKNSPQWVSIAERIPNSRRYVWEVPAKTPFRIYVKVRATDKATNTGEAIANDPVIIDLDKPSAVIPQVVTVGGSSVLGTSAVSPVPATNVPMATTPELQTVPNTINPSR